MITSNECAITVTILTLLGINISNITIVTLLLLVCPGIAIYQAWNEEYIARIKLEEKIKNIEEWCPGR